MFRTTAGNFRYYPIRMYRAVALVWERARPSWHGFLLDWAALSVQKSQTFTLNGRQNVNYTLQGTFTKWRKGDRNLWKANIIRIRNTTKVVQISNFGLWKPEFSRPKCTWKILWRATNNIKRCIKSCVIASDIKIQKRKNNCRSTDLLFIKVSLRSTLVFSRTYLPLLVFFSVGFFFAEKFGVAVYKSNVKFLILWSAMMQLCQNAKENEWILNPGWSP